MAARRILVVGSGGREHALAWRLARDPDPAQVWVAPGNDGIGLAFPRAVVGERENGDLARIAHELGVDLVVIGPEAPLAAGAADALEEAGIPVFGPGRAAARIESSKWFAKEVLTAAGVPTARAERFEALAPACAALDRFAPPYVLKADGLAAGKGVRVTSDRADAEAFLGECLEADRFGAAGRAVLVEEFLAGEEASVVAVCDGERHVLLPPARDYKRAFDGDRGPNTGGMGACAPHPDLDPGAERDVSRRVVEPVLAELARRGTPYRGALYCGLMTGPAGPRVVEFNCRFGDPETQVTVPLIAGDLGRLLASAARGRLDAAAIERHGEAAVTVALVDEGYPDRVRGGGTIAGLNAVAERPGVRVFHAGCAQGGDDVWKVQGGRAAYVTGVGPDLAAARAQAYEAVAALGGSGWRCRRDIAAFADPERPEPLAVPERAGSGR